MTTTVAQLKNVVKDYSMGEVTYRALHGVSLEIARDDFAVIIGPSGAGKSTVLHILGAIDFPTEGESLLNNRNTNSMDDNELSRFRLNHLGFIFQEFNLVEVLTVYENVEYPLSINNTPEKEAREKVEWILNEVGLYRYKDHKSTELSGGQRQRVAIARALVNSPDLVLADEPTAALDSKTGHEILDLMQKMNEEKIAAFFFATHDPDVMKYAKRKIQIKDGLITGEAL